MDFSSFNQLDWVIAAVVVVSAILGIWRGVVKEVLSIVGWVVGLFLAFQYSTELASHLTFFNAFGEVGQVAVAAIVIVFATLIAFALFGELLRLLIKAVTGGLGDSLLGLGFGLLRGAVIVVVCAFLASFTSAPQTRWWQKSVLIPYAEQAIGWVRPMMPDSLQAIEKIAREKQAQARAAWDEKFRIK